MFSEVHRIYTDLNTVTTDFFEARMSNLSVVIITEKKRGQNKPENVLSSDENIRKTLPKLLHVKEDFSNVCVADFAEICRNSARLT